MNLPENKETERLTEEQFFSLVSLIAGNYGCRIVDIDIDRRVINIAGPTENEMACALELNEILYKYTASREKELYVRRQQ